MPWFAILCLLILLVWVGSVKSILVFTFCAISSFLFVRNLFDSDFDLDFTRIFVTKGPKPGEQNGSSVFKAKVIPPSLDECRKTAIKNILRDFVVSWFQNVGVEERFVVETRTLLEEATDCLHDKIAQTDVTSYAEKLCIVLHKHFADYQVAKLYLMKEKGVFKNEDSVDIFVNAYQSLEGKPGVCKNDELSYLRIVVDLLLHELVPKKTLDCDTGRFILREILAVNLFLPLLDSLSDPDFVNMSIINVFGEAGQDNETNALECNDSSQLDNGTNSTSVESSKKKEIDSDIHGNSPVVGNSVDNALSTKSTETTVIKENCGETVQNSTKQKFGPVVMSEALPPNSDNDNHSFNNPRMSSKTNPANPPKSNDNCSSSNEELKPFISPSHGNLAKTNHNSKNGKGPEDCVFSTPKVKFMMKAQTPPKCDENRGLRNEEQTHSTILPSPIHQTVSKPKPGNENLKTSEKKEYGSKFAKAILSTKIHPGIYMFSKNLVRFNSPPEKRMAQSLTEKLSSKSSLVEGHSDGYISNDTMHNLDLVSPALPRNGEESEDNEINVHENQNLKEPNQDSVHSVLEKKGCTSSFEEVGILDVAADSSKGDTTSAECERTRAESDCDLIKDDKTGEDTEQKENLVFCDKDGSYTYMYVSVEGVNSGDKEAVKFSLSSSPEEWDTGVFEQLVANKFTKDEDDFSLDVSGDYSSNPMETTGEDISSIAEFAIPEVKNPYLMISIPSTEIIGDHSWEPHKRRYTIYNIMFNLKLWPDQFMNDTNSEQSDSVYQRTIKRRYREFMELHNRLSCGPHASYLKDILRPNRKFNSPFFRLDHEVIEGRQHLLESYLKCLVNKRSILNCDDFKGFLGIGDQSQTSFHRQMVEVPRIDKKLRKEVNKLIGHIKTAFDTGPIDGDKEEEYNDIRLVLGEDKTSQDEIRTFEICSGSCKLNHSCCYSGKYFETYIQQNQEDNDTESLGAKQSGQELSQGGKPNQKCVPSILLKQGECSTNNSMLKSKITKQKRNSVVTTSGCYDMEADKDGQINYPFTVTVLNLSCEIFQKQESWVCLEPVQQAANAVFGYFFEWWLESAVSGLITEEQWYHYLTLLTETIWPQGKLITLKKPERTEEMKEKTKEEAVQALSDFFGGVLHCTIGTDAIKTAAREIVDSLQYPEINRQLLLEVLEVTLVEVFPGIVSEQEAYRSMRSC